MFRTRCHVDDPFLQLASGRRWVATTAGSLPSRIFRTRSAGCGRAASPLL